jgi:hypothetical protein
MQILGEKMRNIENKYKDDHSKLVEIIQKNIFSNQNTLSDSKKNIKVEDKTSRLKEKIKSDNYDEFEVRDNAIEYSKSEEDSTSTRKGNLLKSREYENKQFSVTRQNNFNILPQINKNEISDQNMINYKKNNSIQQQVLPKYNRFNDSERVGNALKKIRDDLVYHLQDQSLINKENFNQMDLNFNKLKSEISNQFDYLENKQKLQLESLRYILEHSGDKKLRDVTAKVLDGNFIIRKIYNLGMAFDDVVNRMKSRKSNNIPQDRKDNNFYDNSDNIYEEDEKPRKTNEDFRKTRRTQRQTLKKVSTAVQLLNNIINSYRQIFLSLILDQIGR